MGERVAIIGGGGWGTAIGKVLAEAGNDVCIWAYEQNVTDAINIDHENKAFLPGVTLPDNMKASTDIREVAANKDFIIFATPSLYTIPAVKSLMTVPNIMEGETPIGVLTKGFIATSKGPRLMLQAMEDYLPGSYKDNLVYISGPSHAEEVARGKLTGLIAASRNPMNSVRFKHLMNKPPLMVYSSLDVVGVQVAAAVKNVVAIAFGILDAIKENSSYIGDNTESLLLAAGLNEIQTLAVAMGCTHTETISSIAGVGDLDVTCRSIHGRNRRFGREIVLKDVLAPFADIEDLNKGFAKIGYLPEGAVAVRSVAEFVKQFNLKMPVCMSVYRILNKETLPADEIKRFLEALKNPGVDPIS
jgi:glycerol-3-phosphate dehydrogenase (NAD(P)+)